MAKPPQSSCPNQVLDASETTSLTQDRVANMPVSCIVGAEHCTHTPALERLQASKVGLRWIPSFSSAQQARQCLIDLDLVLCLKFLAIVELLAMCPKSLLRGIELSSDLS